MKNWEKFEKEIVAANGCVGIVDEKIVECFGPYCEQCVFKSVSCSEKRIKWLYSEYEPLKPKLTAREKAFLDEIESNTYIARDKCGALYMYLFYPKKGDTRWSSGHVGDNIRLNAELFPFIRWEDENPWLLSDLRKLKMKEEGE